MTNEQSNELASLTIKKLFDEKSHYVIPIYQRNYEWQEQHIRQLLEDINDAWKKCSHSSYYLGTLVVQKRQNDNSNMVFETLDGQQRLTTLKIICLVLQKLRKTELQQITPNLKFDCRADNISKQSENSQIKAGFTIVEKIINEWQKADDKEWQKTDGKDPLSCFIKYFLNNVVIVRVEVPPHTDLNHYFEIMNTRGEQLEKHEILKAKFLNQLQKSAEESSKESQLFNLIWQACANMDEYVVKNFAKDLRDAIFGNDLTLGTFENNNIFTETILNKMTDATKGSYAGGIIGAITSGKKESNDTNQKAKDEIEAVKLASIINFENFLLIALNIHLGLPSCNEANGMKSLNDKELLNAFNQDIDNKKLEAKSFIFTLLKVRFLFDNYMIKNDKEREADTHKNKDQDQNQKEHWSLKKIVYKENDSYLQFRNTFSQQESKNDADSDTETNIQKKITLLLSMFHVSYPSQNYKYWLLGALQFLYTSAEKNTLNGLNYIQYLENLAHNLMVMRYLLPSDKKSYQEILFTSQQDRKFSFYLDVTDKSSECNLDNVLSYGKIQHNFVFNYVDYLLWKSDDNSLSDAKKSFKFTSKSSVEHFYPQNGSFSDSGNVEDKLSDFDRHCFGNLCLVTARLNSELSNHNTSGKKNYIKNNKVNVGLKFLKMLGMVSETQKWNQATIKTHYDETIVLLAENLNTESANTFNNQNN